MIQGHEGFAQAARLTAGRPVQEDSSELRAAPRIALMLRVGKLCLPNGEFLCVVRDASESGLKVKLFHELEPHTTCELELGTGDRYALEFVWAADGHAGYRFTAGAIDLQALIDEATPFPRRQLRLRLDRPIALSIGNEMHPAQLRDISQHGVLVDFHERLPLGCAIRLEAPGFPVLDGRVRWRLSRAHGIVLQRSFRLDELAALARALQDD